MYWKRRAAVYAHHGVGTAALLVDDARARGVSFSVVKPCGPEEIDSDVPCLWSAEVASVAELAIARRHTRMQEGMTAQSALEYCK